MSTAGADGPSGDARRPVFVVTHQAPVLFGSGTRMFQGLDLGHVPLELVDTAQTAGTMHLRYGVGR